MTEMTPMNPAEEVEILVAEDEDLDRFLIESALKAKRLSNRVRFFENGERLLDYLYSESTLNAHERYVVLTDLNMPIMNGFELITAMNNDSRLVKVPVFVLTSSADDDDVARAMELGVTGYITKEKAGDDFLNCIQMMGKWIKVCSILPV
jgi:CheY-like chemotaxis protein